MGFRNVVKPELACVDCSDVRISLGSSGATNQSRYHV